MAGFQKFPVPRAIMYDAWAYNKKWLGNSFCAFTGAILTSISLYRYNLSRTVLILFY
jgi:hypothetical protein